MARNNFQEPISYLSLFDSTINQGFNRTFDGCDWCLQFMGHVSYEILTDGFNQLYAGDVIQYNQSANLIASGLQKKSDSNLKISRVLLAVN